MSESDWRSATRRGILWSAASFAGARVLTLVSVVVLARLLSPADFGGRARSGWPGAVSRPARSWQA